MEREREREMTRFEQRAEIAAVLDEEEKKDSSGWSVTAGRASCLGRR